MGRLAAAVALTLALAVPAGAQPLQEPAPPPDPAPEIAYRHSTAVGLWWSGSLRRGVQMPAEGPDWFTWDPVRKHIPNRGWRRWGTDRLVRTVLDVIADYRLDNALAPRVGIGDLSRRHGGEFGVRFGGLGHGSHQNGLDDRFVKAGARTIYVGPSLKLEGPRTVVEPLVHHDDHLHVRLALR